MAGDSTVVLKRQRKEVVEDEHEALTLTQLEAEELEKQQHQTLNTKRQKSSASSSSSSSSSPYNHIISFLDEEEEKLSHQDLSSLITTLQQELSPSNSQADPSSAYSATSELIDRCDHVASVATEEGLDDRERVFRHLLEASDDELGLPSRDEGTSSSCSVSDPTLFSVIGNDDVHDSALTNLASLDGLWELEDETANYYALLQSELFVERDEH